MRAFVVVVWVALCAGAVQAEPLFVSSAVRFVIAGGVCVTTPQGWIAAPQTRRGRVGTAPQPYRFSQLGDVVPAFRDTGIGLDVTLKPDRRARLATATFTIERLGPGGWTDRWQRPMRSPNRFWFSQEPGPGRALLPGQFILSAWIGPDKIISYAFRVTRPAPGAALANGCTANLS